MAGVEPLPKEEKLAFKVMLDSDEIGTLRAEEGEWLFSYSDEFQKQTEIKPIANFPDVKRQYRNRSLWPFFALRIPSPEQPAVREFIRKLPHKKPDEGILLKEFGERTIANPFRLVPV
ncbi:MAG: HipA N-terminal domain-containing protein [Verrucomicrobiae bacterium]|nr:HipA N-terminal domain-containing protein [Verrucomicrobiae bacterium]